MRLGARQMRTSRGWTNRSGERALPIMRSTHRFMSELNRTFCRFVITDPGVTPSHPESSTNHIRAANPTTVATLPRLSTAEVADVLLATTSTRCSAGLGIVIVELLMLEF